jgi:hypothetical protein
MLRNVIAGVVFGALIGVFGGSEHYLAAAIFLVMAICYADLVGFDEIGG